MAVLSGRVALVTGASSGLGERFAETLRGAGAEVVVTARRKERLVRLADRSGSILLAGDITSPDHRVALRELIAERFGRLDILVNNAGICDDGPLEDQALEEITTVIQTDLVAVIDLCRLMAPLLFQSDAPTSDQFRVDLRTRCISWPNGGLQRFQGSIDQSDPAPCSAMGGTRCPCECTCAGLLSN